MLAALRDQRRALLHRLFGIRPAHRIWDNRQWDRPPWARHRIRLLADALLRNGTLSGDEIFELAATSMVTA
jgi:hypothetical protein